MDSSAAGVESSCGHYSDLVEREQRLRKSLRPWSKNLFGQASHPRSVAQCHDFTGKSLALPEPLHASGNGSLIFAAKGWHFAAKQRQELQKVIKSAAFHAKTPRLRLFSKRHAFSLNSFMKYAVDTGLGRRERAMASVAVLAHLVWENRPVAFVMKLKPFKNKQYHEKN
jgi:hypothetical protein